MTSSRRSILQAAGAAAAASILPPLALAQTPERHYAVQPGRWRTFEVRTRVDVAPGGATRVWLPVPSVQAPWQEPVDNGWTSNGSAQLTTDATRQTPLLAVTFTGHEQQPYVELVSRVRTQDRKVDWHARKPQQLDAASHAYWTRATALLPTDGIVLATAQKATQGATTDRERAHGIYEWIVTNSYRDPKVRGCGEGDIKTMLETGNLGGKCADLNAIFVGMCRSLGMPARDLYGVRVAKSGSGYGQLGADPKNLSGAQHCRSEVWLPDHGWVAMDPADVTKVMRMETPTWIKTTSDPLVKPIEQALFGSWEGNWIAFNDAHDVVLPGAQMDRLGFFMYPIAEDAKGPFDSYAPEDFKYAISAREIV
jgi:transglutaminase-like putative cysteine protease